MKKIFFLLVLIVSPLMIKAQTYFYKSENSSEVVVIYFVNSNKVIREISYFDNVRNVLMSNYNAYEDNLSRHANDGIYYDMNNAASPIRSCEFKQTLSGYNIYGFWQKYAFYYGNYNNILDLGISPNKDKVVRNITNDTHIYYNRVDKSFFLPQL